VTESGVGPVARSGRYARLPDLRARRIGFMLAGRTVEFVDWGYYAPSQWRNYLHSHSYFEVCYAYAGDGRFRSQDTEFPIGPGVAFVARPGDMHEIEASDSDPLGIAFWSLAVGAGAGGPDWLDGFTDRAAPPVTTRSDGIATVVDLLSDALSEPIAHRERADVLARTLAAETAHAFARIDLSVAGEVATLESSEYAVRTMHRYLRDNLSRPLQVRDVAAQVHLSERQAARLFAASTGESLLAHLRRLRLERAADRLLAGSATVTAIAADAGFYDRRHFSRHFHDYFGVSPSEYREASGTTQTEPMMIDGPQPRRRE
jgi:AraC-like DNA-binding protein